MGLKSEKCPHSTLVMLWVNENNDGHVRFSVPCGRWTCPVCGKKKGMEVYYRAMKGILNYYAKEVPDGNRYACKFVTLTVPGVEYRSAFYSWLYRPEYFGEKSIEDAYNDIRKNYGLLIDALQARPLFKGLKCFGSLEPQQDGYPHIHILMIGKVVANRAILSVIRKLWVGKYKMGSRIDIEPIRKGIKAGVKYAVKYLLKGQKFMPKGVHRYFASSGLMAESKREKALWTAYALVSVLGGVDRVLKEFNLAIPFMKADYGSGVSGGPFGFSQLTLQVYKGGV